MFRVFLLAVCLAVPAYGNSAGAPLKICSNGLTPEHHVDGQTSAMPYSISGGAGVKAGNKLTLTLGGGDFLGFAIQARDAKNNPIGKFKVVENTKSQTLDCKGQADTLTHKKIPKDNPLTLLDFEWMAPVGYNGKVKFVATVAKNGGVYWIEKPLKTIDVQ